MATNNSSDIPTGASGTVLRGQGIGSALAFSTATYPATAGTSGNVLTSDGTNFNSSAPVAATPTPNSTINLFDDFLSCSNSNNTNGTQCWLEVSGLTGIPFLPANSTENNRPGILASQSLTTVNNESTIILGGTSSGSVKQLGFVLGGGILTLNWVVKIATLSTGTNRYTIRFGLGDTVSADQVNGLYFEYSDNINSGNWNCKSASASTRTTSSSSTAVGTGWNNLQIVVNAAASSVAFNLNGSLLETITTNIPSTALTPMIDMLWVAGTVPASSVLIDLFYLSQVLTTPR